MTPEVTTLIKLETVADLDGAKRFDDQQKKSQRTINSVTKDLKIQERMLRKKGRSYNYVKASVSGATKEELKAILAMEKNIARMKQSEAAMQKQNKTLRMMRGGFGQVGHQVQDVAVQLQGGTDAMIVFGQQGSQIVSLFGPGGAMLGAVLAVGAALITSFKPAVDESASAVKEFVKDITDQRRELGLLTDAEKELDAIRRASTISQINEETDNLQGSLEHLTQTHDRYARMLKGVKEGDQDAMFAAHQLGLSYQDLEEDTAALAKRLGLSKATIASNTEATDSGTEANIKAAKADKERLEKINELIRAAAEQAHTVGMSAREQALYRAQVEGANQTQLDAIDHMYDLIEAHEAAEKAAKKQAKANDEASKAALKAIEAEAKARRKANNEEIDYFTGTLGQILSLTEDKKLAAEMEAQERLNVAKEALDRQILDEVSYAEAVFAIHRDLHNKLAEIKGTSGQGPERTIVDIGTDFDALIESQKTELDLFREHQEAKLALINEYEQTGVDSTRDFAAMRKQIADETAAYEVGSRLATLSTVTGLMSQQLSQLSAFYDESSGLGKAMFVANQAVAAANAMISAFEAKSKAEAALAHNPPLAMAMGNMMLMSGIMSAAAIAGQTVASFEGGGMTFSGVRSGGMDGKGGRMAMVHPNEKITDMEKESGSAQPVNVNINISAVDAKGVDELLVKRRGMITNLVRSSLANSGSRLG